MLRLPINLEMLMHYIFIWNVYIKLYMIKHILTIIVINAITLTALGQKVLLTANGSITIINNL